MLLLIQNSSLFKNNLKHAYIDQCRVAVFNCLFLGKFRSRQRDVQFCRYSPNSRCHVSSCIFAVLLGSSSAISSLRNVICSAILCCSTKTTQTFPQNFSVAVHFSAVVFILSSTYCKHLPNLVNAIAVAGYEDLSVEFELIGNGEIFWVNNN